MLEENAAVLMVAKENEAVSLSEIELITLETDALAQLNFPGRLRYP
jgi:hypothetical protein